MSMKICQLSHPETFTPSPKMPNKPLSSHLAGSVLGSAVKNVHRHYFSTRCSSNRFRNQGTQTDYRENDCQTIPWEPPYKIAEGHNPEVLTQPVVSFVWGDGLPPGMREIELINRMRMRRAWERVMPPMDTPCNMKTRIAIIAALEADEWTYRDSEMQMIMNLRMELAEKALETKEKERNRRKILRLEKLGQVLKERKQRELRGIKCRLSRELRKLAARRRRCGTRSLTRELCSSQYKDTKPRYACRKIERIENEFEEEIDCPGWLHDNDTDQENECKECPCPRFAQRNRRALLRLADDKLAESMGMSNQPCSLLKRKDHLETPEPTPRLSWPSICSEDRLDNAAEILQDLVSARAKQAEFLEGKNRCAELIEELRASAALEQSKDAIEEFAKTLQRRDEERKAAQENKTRELLQAIEGKTIAKTLMVLNEELSRLEGERRCQTLMMLAERERMSRLIERACKKGAEEIERSQQEEMMRQMLQVDRESAHAYLEDLLADNVDWSSGRKAEEYISEFADRLDAVTKFMDENMEKIDEEGFVADMVYQILLPEVERQSVRDRLDDQRDARLHAAEALVSKGIKGATVDVAQNTETEIESCEGVEEIKSHSQEKDNLESGTLKNECEEKDSLPNVIELILNLSSVSEDDDCKQQVYIILEEMLCLARQKLMICD